MRSSRRPSTVTSKFVAIYSKLLQGVPPEQLDQSGDAERLISELLDLNVDRGYLSLELKRLPKDTAAKAKYRDVKKIHALKTLTILVDACLSKNPSGWEVMEMLAGSVAQSDRTFNDFTAMLNDIIADDQAPVETRYQALELGLVFACSISQLSPGAYFLRRNLFPAIVAFIKSPDTDKYTFQAILFIAILANYHKSDAAKLNPYLKRIKESEDVGMMVRLNAAVRASLGIALKEYTSICGTDRNSVNLALSFTSAVALLRPGRLLSRVTQGSTTASPMVAEKPQPVESAVALLPLYEFLRGNPGFVQTLVQPLEDGSGGTDAELLATFLNFASHLFTHGSTSSSPRTSSYVNLTLEIVLTLVERNQSMDKLTSFSSSGIRLCHQRLPKLPLPRPGRSLVCEILDCCNLWLRHNLHRRLPTQSYSKCIWICHRVVWRIHDRRTRLGVSCPFRIHFTDWKPEYEWKELWNSVLGLLSFLASKIDSLITTGGIEQLLSDTLSFLAFATSGSEIYLPSPQANYELVYELVRNAEMLEKQQYILDNLALTPSHGRFRNEALSYMLRIVQFYRDKIMSKGGLNNASDAMKVIAQELESNGLHIPEERFETDLEPRSRSEEVLDFARFACGDGLVLVAG